MKASPTYSAWLNIPDTLPYLRGNLYYHFEKRSSIVDCIDDCKQRLRCFGVTFDTETQNCYYLSDFRESDAIELTWSNQPHHISWLKLRGLQATTLLLKASSEIVDTSLMKCIQECINKQCYAVSYLQTTCYIITDTLAKGSLNNLSVSWYNTRDAVLSLPPQYRQYNRGEWSSWSACNLTSPVKFTRERRAVCVNTSSEPGSCYLPLVEHELCPNSSILNVGLENSYKNEKKDNYEQCIHECMEDHECYGTTFDSDTKDCSYFPSYFGMAYSTNKTSWIYYPGQVVFSNTALRTSSSHLSYTNINDCIESCRLYDDCVAITFAMRTNSCYHVRDDSTPSYEDPQHATWFRMEGIVPHIRLTKPYLQMYSHRVDVCAQECMRDPDCAAISFKREVCFRYNSSSTVVENDLSAFSWFKPQSALTAREWVTWGGWTPCTIISRFQRRDKLCEKAKPNMIGTECKPRVENRRCIGLDRHFNFITALLSRNKKTKQGSTKYGGTSDKAVDGNYAQMHIFCTYTQSQKHPWWRVDLGDVHKILLVKLWNRGECCGDWLTSLAVDSSNDQTHYKRIGFINNAAPHKMMTYDFNTNVYGRYVYMWLTKMENGTLNLCEVEVWGRQISTAYTLLSRGKKVTQHSVYTKHNGNPEHAVNGIYFVSHTYSPCTHTDWLYSYSKNESVWWQVDLGAVYQLVEVRVYNRGDCCGDRLTSLVVESSENALNYTQIAALEGTGTNRAVYDFNVTSSGRYVRLRLTNLGWQLLTVCEVEVWGYERYAKYEPCKFPFTYNGNTYYSCALNEKEGYYWCSHDVFHSNGSERWSKCAKPEGITQATQAVWSEWSSVELPSYRRSRKRSCSEPTKEIDGRPCNFSHMEWDQHASILLNMSLIDSYATSLDLDEMDCINECFLSIPCHAVMYRPSRRSCELFNKTFGLTMDPGNAAWIDYPGIISQYGLSGPHTLFAKVTLLKCIAICEANASCYSITYRYSSEDCMVHDQRSYQYKADRDGQHVTWHKTRGFVSNMNLGTGCKTNDAKNAQECADMCMNEPLCAAITYSGLICQLCNNKFEIRNVPGDISWFKLYDLEHRRVNGGWSHWTYWSTCDAMHWTRFRQRACNDQTPRFGGKPCPEESRIDMEPCIGTVLPGASFLQAYRNFTNVDLVSCHALCDENEFACMALSYNRMTRVCHVYHEKDLHPVLDGGNLYSWIRLPGMMAGVDFYEDAADSISEPIGLTACAQECVKRSNCYAAKFDFKRKRCHFLPRQLSAYTSTSRAFVFLALKKTGGVLNIRLHNHYAKHRILTMDDCTAICRRDRLCAAVTYDFEMCYKFTNEFTYSTAYNHISWFKVSAKDFRLDGIWNVWEEWKPCNSTEAYRKRFRQCRQHWIDSSRRKCPHSNKMFGECPSNQLPTIHLSAPSHLTITIHNTSRANCIHQCNQSNCIARMYNPCKKYCNIYNKNFKMRFGPGFDTFINFRGIAIGVMIKGDGYMKIKATNIIDCAQLCMRILSCRVANYLMNRTECRLFYQHDYLQESDDDSVAWFKLPDLIAGLRFSKYAFYYKRHTERSAELCVWNCSLDYTCQASVFRKSICEKFIIIAETSLSADQYSIFSKKDDDAIDSMWSAWIPCNDYESFTERHKMCNPLSTVPNIDCSGRMKEVDTCLDKTPKSCGQYLDNIYWPWLVSFYEGNIRKWKFLCVATIINHDHIVTSQACLGNILRLNRSVILGNMTTIFDDRGLVQLTWNSSIPQDEQNPSHSPVWLKIFPPIVLNYEWHAACLSPVEVTKENFTRCLIIARPCDIPVFRQTKATVESGYSCFPNSSFYDIGSPILSQAENYFCPIVDVCEVAPGSPLICQLNKNTVEWFAVGIYSHQDEDSKRWLFNSFRNSYQRIMNIFEMM